MKVGVPGSGDRAKTLAAGFMTHSHEVMVGFEDTRQIESVGEGSAKSAVGNLCGGSSIR